MQPGMLLRLLQLCDSTFPTGGYAFSNGVEGLTQLGLIRTEEDVMELIRTQVEEGLAGLELPAMFHAHRATGFGDLVRLLEVDAYLTALKPVPPFRAASTKVGRRFLESAAALVDGASLAGYRSAIAAGRADGHHAIAFGVVMKTAGVAENEAAAALGSIFVGGQTAAAVRLGLIGQGAAQRIIARTHPHLLAATARAREMPLNEMGAYLPMTDLAGLRQESLPSRLFAS